jgi:hypothetical protein
MEKLTEEMIFAAFNGKLNAEVLILAARIAELAEKENELLTNVGYCKRLMEKSELDTRILVADTMDETGRKPLFSNEGRREDEVKLRLRNDENHAKALTAMREYLTALTPVRIEMEYYKHIIELSRMYDSRSRLKQVI